MYCLLPHPSQNCKGEPASQGAHQPPPSPTKCKGEALAFLSDASAPPPLPTNMRADPCFPGCTSPPLSQQKICKAEPYAFLRMHSTTPLPTKCVKA
ncbi:hypothetical protein LSTR_LSTR009378 [Laodelphax striatellus]|uniref:Uncharacterized protein n=1 Tax=Laodelphax striatellus TaxID=195883 RepID=A0A482XLI2_LAOST|nr:hypothetical protein LSTR_LSTR009378 [Laodelphax striatellus]